MQDNRDDGAKREGKQKGKEIQKLRELKEEVERYRPDLIINKVPKGELRIFKAISKEEFGGDYGMTLKFLILHYAEDLRMVDCIDRISRLERMLLDLNAPDDVDEYNDYITALDGSNIDVTKR